MWIVLILTLAAMSALTIIQTPREWLKHKLLRILLLIYHTVGITSIALILFAVYRMKDGVLREVIIWTETFYFTLTVFALLLSAVRYFGFELARHFRHRKILKILSSQTAFFLAAILISAAYMKGLSVPPRRDRRVQPQVERLTFPYLHLQAVRE